MKKFYLSLIVMLCAYSSFAQVDVTATGGTLTASYTTLKDAFDQVNLGTHTGTINMSLSGNTTETASAVLNASGSGSASYTTLAISPTGGAARTITGAIVGHMIDLNGADNVTIDGLNTGGNSLTISNTDQGTSTSTIRLVNDATGNTVTNATVLGSSGAALSSGFGVIYFGIGTTTGNDNNTISNCSISAAGANLPINGIYSFGSSTAIDNSGITVANNTISNFFNTNSASNGINLNSANSSWTITGNNIFQTATRTYLTASTHNGIFIGSGSGYTINNNFIGGSAANAGGTPYVMAGTVATRFVVINASAGTTTAVNNIQGNTIANITLNTSSGASTGNGIICGISLSSGNFNVGTVTGNTIGSTTGIDNIKATPTTAGGLVVGINVASSGTVSIQNNSIGSITSSGTTAAISGSITGVNISGTPTSLTISGNTIGNGTANNMRGGTSGLTTGSSLVSGINLVSTPTTAIVNNNTIQNLSSFGTGTTGFVRGILTATSASATAVGWSISNNTINNLITNSSFAGFGSGLVSAQGIHHLASQGCVINQNSISNIANTNNTATTNIIVAGIVSANATVTTSLGISITKNKIWGLSNATIGATSLTPPIVAGIAIRSGNNIASISNNMISLGNTQTTNTSFIGIWCQNGSAPTPTTMNIYFNSVHIEGTTSAGALASFAFLRSQFITVTSNTVTVDVKNNIFQNNRSGGTGQHFAISNGFNSTTVSATGWAANASNNNVLNANVATIGHWTSALNFAGWKTSSASDGASVSAVSVPFVNSANGDLHVNFGVTPTTLESAGIPIAGLTIDYDNDTRPGPVGSVNGAGFAPDLGADEFDGVYLDLGAPVISYNPLLFTCGTGSRTLTATITDASGVPTSGAGLPVLYWKINAGAYTAATASSLGANQYQFSFGAGVVTGDVVSYYIVAQDNAVTPNVGAFPIIGAAGLTANPPAAATPPTSPSTYVISTGLAPGTYTVGVAGTYTTLTAAIADYNSKCLTGPIVFELLDATFNEAGAMTIIKHPDASATNTLTIRPAAGVTSTVSANAASAAIIKILGSYVTIDGSNNGTTSRNLTLTNASVTSPSVVHIGSTGTSPITNVTLKNCIVINGVNTASAIVTSDGSTLGNEGYFNNISIVNNDIQRAFIGAYTIAFSLAGNGSGMNLSNNQLNAIGANAIRRIGIYVQGVDGATVSNNTLANFESATVENDIAIWLATGTVNTTVSNNAISNIGYTGTTANAAPTGINITSNIAAANITVTGNTLTAITSTGGGVGNSTNGIFLGFGTGNVNITRNKINLIRNSNASGWGANGILLSSTSVTANVLVANNFVSNVFGLGFASASPDDNGYGISVNGGAGYNIYHNTVVLDSNQTAAGGLPAAFFVSAGVTTAGAINLRNNIFVIRQTAGSTERYAIYAGAANTVFAAIDNNDYFSSGANLGFIGSNRNNLAAIQAGFTGNVNSLNVVPVFVSSTDIHLNTTANISLDNTGVPIATVPIDIDGETRSTTTPDMGADEFTFFGYCAGANVNYVSNISGATYQWQVDLGSGFTNIVDGAVYGGTATNTLTLTAPPTAYNNYRYRCVVDGTSFSNVFTYTVGNNWTGAINTDWTVPGNWSCGTVPDQYTNVQINAGAPNYPVVGLNVTIRSLKVNTGATVTVSPGFTMTITGF